MHYLALATDYDGTIAHDGVVDAPTIAALERLRASGRAVILVTGREREDLSRIMPRMDLFDHVVAENGALLYHPATGKEWPQGAPPPERFIARLRALGVDPLSVGRCIVATSTLNQPLIAQAIGETGVDLRIVLNKGSLMVLPPGIDKASGLSAALAALGIAPAQAVAVGDAENDLPFLRCCGMTVAVANAVPTLKREAALVTAGSHGAGVAELIALWLAGALAPPVDMRRAR
jgi:hypothetical protein